MKDSEPRVLTITNEGYEMESDEMTHEYNIRLSGV